MVRPPRPIRGRWVLGLPLALATLVAHGLASGDGRAGAISGTEPVSGPSMLRRAGTRLEGSKLGQLGGLEPTPAVPEPMPTPVHADVIFDLAGADLYRLACQSCHGPDAKGAPPEVNDLVGPARATSPALMAKRMRDLGHPVDEHLIHQLATDAGTAMRQKIHDGGPKMPSFSYLRPAESDAIVAYLGQLAGVPDGAKSLLRVGEPAMRVGELLVQGTCHVCHDATGPWAGRMMMMHGAIPSLESLPQQWTVEQVVAKVREGRSGMMPMMGMMRMHGMQRMPVYPYVTPQEVVAAYIYLARIRPTP